MRKEEGESVVFVGTENFVVKALGGAASNEKLVDHSI